MTSRGAHDFADPTAVETHEQRTTQRGKSRHGRATWQDPPQAGYPTARGARRSSSRVRVVGARAWTTPRMLVDALTTPELPLEVRAGRAQRASAARRARHARRGRARRRTLALAASAACALVAVPAVSDASRPLMATARPGGRCALPSGLRADFAAAARAANLPLGLLAGVAYVESRFSAAAESPAGAVGVMQLMPSTAHSLHLDALAPSSNVLGGALYLRQLLSRYGGDLKLALAAYNAGPTAVDRAGGAPSAETRAYVGRVERTWHSYGSCALTTEARNAAPEG